MIYKLNETLEYRLKNPFSKSVMTFYHASHIGDLDVIKPNSANSGTILSKPRMSSFWSMDKDTCKMVSIYLTFYSKSDPTICDCARKKVYVSKEKFDHLKKIEDEGNLLYLYEADIPTKYMSIGHDIIIDEYSCDVEVKPKKMYKYKPTESNILEIKSKEEITNIIKTKGSVIGSRKFKGIERLLYHKDLSTYDRTARDISKYNEFYMGSENMNDYGIFESVDFLNEKSRFFSTSDIHFVIRPLEEAAIIFGKYSDIKKFNYKHAFYFSFSMNRDKIRSHIDMGFKSLEEDGKHFDDYGIFSIEYNKEYYFNAIRMYEFGTVTVDDLIFHKNERMEDKYGYVDKSKSVAILLKDYKTSCMIAAVEGYFK